MSISIFLEKKILKLTRLLLTIELCKLIFPINLYIQVDFFLLLKLLIIDRKFMHLCKSIKNAYDMQKKKKKN